MARGPLVRAGKPGPKPATQPDVPLSIFTPRFQFLPHLPAELQLITWLYVFDSALPTIVRFIKSELESTGYTYTLKDTYRPKLLEIDVSSRSFVQSLIGKMFERPRVYGQDPGYGGDVIPLRWWVTEHFRCRYNYNKTQPSGHNDYGICGAIRHDKVKNELFHKDFLLDLCLHEEAQDMEECDEEPLAFPEPGEILSSTMRRLRYG